LSRNYLRLLKKELAKNRGKRRQIKLRKFQMVFQKILGKETKKQRNKKGNKE